MNKFIALCCSLLLYQNSLFAAQLNLPQTPLGMGNTLPPNVFFQLDDSGSMDWEVLPKTYWEACAYDPNITGGLNVYPICGTTWSSDDGIRSYANGSYKNFNYIYNNNDNAYNSGCNNPFFQDNAIEACPIAGQRDWRIYSSGLNAVYYNPSVTYQPWLYNCVGNNPCRDANFFAARSYPVQGMPGYSQVRNLTGGRYDVWIDDKGYSGARPYRTILLNATNTPNGETDVWDSHVTFEFVAGNSIRVYSTSYNPNAVGLNPTTVLRATLSGGACYDVLGSNQAVTEIFASGSGYTGTGGDSCRTIAETQQNFANWYEFSRRRAMAARGNIAVVMNDHPNFRYGFNTINNRIFIEVPPDSATDFAPYNDNILQQLFNYRWQALGTPNRSALNRVGQYYMGNLRGTRNPITESCQQNYTVFITDGFWNPESIPGYIGDVDGDGISQTFADVARYYYQTDLSSLTNNVNPSAWDPATWQHMVTFTVSYGVSGNLVAGSNGWPNPPLTESSNWGNPFTNQPAKIDDLWHAAYNSRGAFFNALNPTDASEGLSSILGNVAQRAASAAPVAQDSSILSANSSIYQATFDTTHWTGDILAYTININGTINPAPQWSAACMLNGGNCSNPVGSNPGITFNNRVIITRSWDGSNTGTAFRFPNDYNSYRMQGNRFPANLEAFLDDAPNNLRTRNRRRIQENQEYGEALLNYLRGNHQYEEQNSNQYQFRNRSNVLGDIVNSSPAFIPPPFRNYPDNLENSAYSAFKANYANRIPMLFFGGNDGMLHGLDATSGSEIFAYVPGDKYIYENLPGLSNRNFVHKFFVNAPPKEADVYINGRWRTIVTGTLGSGGQTLYLLDITNPSLLSENRANQIYLWEFSDLVDDRLGFVMNAPIVAKVRTGANQSKWAIIVNNGYNSNQNDGDRSNGRPTLFILLIEDIIDSGFRLNQTYYRIEVGSNSNNDANGLSAPYAVDLDSDYVVDLVYAGDLHGNLWRFDLRSGNPANWSNNASILFTAQHNASRDQPITAAPIAGPHPQGLAKGVLVYFGTGKYLEPNDNSTSNQTTQAFYAIWDKMDGNTVNKSTLVQQQILGEVTVGSGATAQTYRAVSSNPVNWNVTPPPQNQGWYINLFVNGANSNNGERIVSQAILRNNNVIFTTLIPPSTPCDTGGNSWIMEVNAASGGSPALTPFDVNNDGSFTIADYLKIDSGGSRIEVPAAGIKSTVGATGMPTIFMAPDRNSEIKVLSGSQGLGTIRENSGTAIGRQNWRQLY